jgi:cell cycle checkpoint protein
MKCLTGKFLVPRGSDGMLLSANLGTILFSSRYKYKFLRATTANVPSSVMKENRRTKVTIGRGGMLKIQHLISLARPGMPYFRNIGGGTEQTSRIAHVEFFVKPEEDDNDA